ncbi:MAG: hypothetical protein AABY95_10305 [Pseudomonadota bacterium]
MTNQLGLKRLPGMALLILVAGCDVSVDSAPRAGHSDACVSLSGDDLSVTFTTSGTCLNCSVANTKAAIDGDPTTYATLSVTAATNSEVALRVSSGSGSIVPARAVTVKLRANAGAFVSQALYLRTFFRGFLVSAYSAAGAFPGASIPDDFEIQMETPPFDTVEFAFGQTIAGFEMDVFDFCFVPELPP